VFERFTERARQAIVLGLEEARLLRHNYVGTEHLLLGLLREEESQAAMVLEGLGVSLPHTRAHVVRIVGAGDSPSADQVPWTPRAKRVLELAVEEGGSRGHDHVGTEHLLLGLLREGKGVGVRVLVELGADLELIQRELDPALGRELDDERSAVLIRRRDFLVARLAAADRREEVVRVIAAARDRDEVLNELSALLRISVDSAQDVLDMRLRGLERDAIGRLRQELQEIEGLLGTSG
jgi:ATP-dependent Clp protease ATP-binding subunit ClpA